MTNEFVRILENIAQKHDATPGEVYREMRAAIGEGFHSTEPEAQAWWSMSPFSEHEPTPESLTSYLAALARNRWNT